MGGRGGPRSLVGAHLGKAGSEEHALEELAHSLQELIHMGPLQHIDLGGGYVRLLAQRLGEVSLGLGGNCGGGRGAQEGWPWGLWVSSASCSNHPPSQRRIERSFGSH